MFTLRYVLALIRRKTFPPCACPVGALASILVHSLSEARVGSNQGIEVGIGAIVLRELVCVACVQVGRSDGV